jgi:hypothetical protein
MENKVRLDSRLHSSSAYKVTHLAIVPAASRANQTNAVHAGVSQFSNTD